MKVRFLTDYQSHRSGTEADLPDAQARNCIAAGAAEEVEGGHSGHGSPSSSSLRAVPGAQLRGVPAEAEGEAVMRVRFRHDATVGGKSYLSGTRTTLPQSPEAWDAVNQGHADLDPAPGVAGQPFPPEDVTRDEKSEAPLPPTPEEIARAREESRERLGQQRAQKTQGKAASGPTTPGAADAARPGGSALPPGSVTSTGGGMDAAREAMEKGAREGGARTPKGR